MQQLRSAAAALHVPLPGEAHLDELLAQLVAGEAFQLGQLLLVVVGPDQAEAVPVGEQLLDGLPDLRPIQGVRGVGCQGCWSLADMRTAGVSPEAACAGSISILRQPQAPCGNLKDSLAIADPAIWHAGRLWLYRPQAASCYGTGCQGEDLILGLHRLPGTVQASQSCLQVLSRRDLHQVSPCHLICTSALQSG